MAGTKLLMTFPVTATSHTLAEYRGRGGYASLEKALTEMKPEHVTREVTTSGIQGRGGAAFPMGRKWAVVHPNDGQPHYLCANADEGEPGTFKDRWILEFAPHLLVESMLIDIEIRKRGEIACCLDPIRLGIDDQMLIHRECALPIGRRLRIVAVESRSLHVEVGRIFRL